MSLLDVTSRPAASAKATKTSSTIRCEIVQSVTHWTDRLFSFTTSRDAEFRFRSGQFTYEAEFESVAEVERRDC